MSDLPRDRRLALGVDLGASHLAAALVDSAGGLLGWQRRPVDPADGPEAIIRQAAALLGETLRAHPEEARRVAGTGIGLPGLVEEATGRLIFAPNLHWRDFPVGERLGEALGLPVRADNDARLATLGETLFGAGQGCSDLLGVWIGTGIGGGIVLGGRLFRGIGGSAGEIGHFPVLADGPPCSCGSQGCLETLAAGPAIAAAGRAVLLQAIRQGWRTPLRASCGDDPGAVTARTVTRAAGLGDPGAREVLERAGTYLGIALAGYCNLNNPQRVVVGGGVAGAGEHLLGPARREIARRAMVIPRELVRVVPAALDEAAVVVGAGALVLGEY